MSGPVPAELSRDHAELRRLSARLREALSAVPGAGGGLPVAISPLLASLFQHETREMAALRSVELDGEDAARALAVLEGDHLSLRALAKDIELVMAHPDLYPADQLARLARRLPDALEFHLDFEETRVFPAFF